MIDLRDLTTTTSHFGVIALALAFAAGIAASLGPASYALVPAIVGFGVGFGGHKTVLLRASFASVGVVLVSALIGTLAGAFGAVVMQWFGAHIVVLYAIGAAAFARIGLRFLGLRKFGAFGLAIPLFTRRSTGLWDAFALGCALAIAACPACTPILAAVVLGAVAVAQPLAGAVLLAAFGLGRTMPVFGLAISAHAFARFGRVRRFVGAFERAGGVLLLLSAIYLSYEAIATWLAFQGSGNPMPGM